MTEEEIVHTALENLQKETKIRGKWVQGKQNALDGQLMLTIDNNRLTFNLEIKNELRNYLLPQILEYNRKHKPFMLVAGRLFPNIREQLKENNVAYLEANGNFYLKDKRRWLMIDTNPPLQIEQDNRSRAFTKTGLKVVFEFLEDQTLIHQPYRHIAEYTETAVGNVTNIIKGLRQEGFILQINKFDIKLINQKELVRKWVEAYDQKLKPTLKTGTFRLLDEQGYANWNKTKLNVDKTWWGGEPAGDLLTNYLRPVNFTLYTTETRAELMKNYKLVPDKEGKVQVFKKFWKRQDDAATVPPLLVYADLINTDNPRCIETAEKIHEQYLKSKLE